MSGSEFNSTTTPVARKHHRCEECGRDIFPGERYSRTAAVWAGDFFTNVACMHCDAAREIVAEIDPDYRECYYNGGLAEWLRELWADFDPEGDGTWRLAACFFAKWRYQSGAIMPVPSLEGEGA